MQWLTCHCRPLSLPCLNANPSRKRRAMLIINYTVCRTALAMPGLPKKENLCTKSLLDVFHRVKVKMHTRGLSDITVRVHFNLVYKYVL